MAQPACFQIKGQAAKSFPQIDPAAMILTPIDSFYGMFREKNAIIPFPWV